MTSPARIVHTLAGAPQLDGCAPDSGRCAICGLECDRAIPYAKWQGTAFASQNQLACPGSPRVCEPCMWACSWVAPPGHVDPGTVKVIKKVGGKQVIEEKERKRTSRLTQYSHLWSEAEGYWYANKSERRRIYEWIRAPKSCAWFAALSDDGKKHALPFAPLNPALCARPSVCLEGDAIALGDWSLVDAMADLIARKIGRSQIEKGEFSGIAWKDHSGALIEFERAHGRMRGSGWFRLALFLAPKPEEDACPQSDAGSSRPTQSSATKNSTRTSTTSQLSLL